MHMNESRLIRSTEPNVDGKDIALIGVGRIGTGIGINLIRHGARLHVMANKNRNGVDCLLKLGASECMSVAEMAKIGIVVLSLPSSTEVESICQPPNGLFAYLLSGSVIIDCSTSKPSSTHALAKDAARSGIHFVDSPVTRSPEQALQGKLNALVGADLHIYPTVSGVVASFCEGIIHAGGVGAGHKLKLIYNGMTMGIAAVVAETCQLAKKSDIDLRLLRDIVSQGSTNSGIFQKFVTFLLSEDRDVLSVSITNASKDIGYTLELAEQEEIVLPTLNMASQKLQTAVSLGDGLLTLPHIARS
ncbi:NAD(P)-dependent oxidoreductase [Paraburkholderia sp. EG287A]|uniref:NAD(P)-dependent oxidoreductase n=1 Tax=unclassified Paraburkholderia TaxID=2615204 RepID=UPI0034D1875E